MLNRDDLNLADVELSTASGPLLIHGTASMGKTALFMSALELARAARAKTKIAVLCEGQEEASALNALVRCGKVSKFVWTGAAEALSDLYQRPLAVPQSSISYGPLLVSGDVRVALPPTYLPPFYPPNFEVCVPVVSSLAPVFVDGHALFIEVQSKASYWDLLDFQREGIALAAAMRGEGIWGSTPNSRDPDEQQAPQLGRTNDNSDPFLIFLTVARRRYVAQCEEDPSPSVLHEEWCGRTVTGKNDVTDPPHLGLHPRQDATARTVLRRPDRRPGGWKWNVTSIGKLN